MKIKDFSVKYFEEKYVKEKNSSIKQRLHILLLLREGYTQREVSKMLHISVGKVPFWKARFEKEGLNGLVNKTKAGRPTKLSKKILSALSRQLKNIKSEDDQMIISGWNTKQIKDIIREETGISYSIRHTRRLAHKIGLALITPRVRHIRKDEKKIKKFRKEFKKNFRLAIKGISS